LRSWCGCGAVACGRRASGGAGSSAHLTSCESGSLCLTWKMRPDTGSIRRPSTRSITTSSGRSSSTSFFTRTPSELSVSAWLRVLGNPSRSTPRWQSFSTSLSFTMPHITSSGTSDPLSMNWASEGRNLARARSRSPVLMCTSPYRLSSSSHCVPLPQAGGPAIMMHEFNAACPVQLLLSSAVVAIAIFAERVRGEKEVVYTKTRWWLGLDIPACVIC
jgi:hypothetical protein